MGEKTGISWTDSTMNAIRGCTPVSDGCTNCYAASQALRFSGPGLPYEGLAQRGRDDQAEWTGVVKLIPEKLRDPLRWQRPRRIFVNSMSDLFHPGVPRDFVDQHFATFALAERHQFQILTKRPLRMARYLNDPNTPSRVSRHMDYLHETNTIKGPRYVYPRWPLPNVWVGTSVEDNRVIERVRHLRDCTAAVRFLSCEPLIGPLPNLNLDGIQWVIAGGESGPNHRPIEADWVRDLRDQCATAGVSFFFKQWGGPTPKSGGKALDGREWCDFPQVAA
jgi:protein gp37